MQGQPVVEGKAFCTRPGLGQAASGGWAGGCCPQQLWGHLAPGPPRQRICPGASLEVLGTPTAHVVSSLNMGGVVPCTPVVAQWLLLLGTATPSGTPSLVEQAELPSGELWGTLHPQGPTEVGWDVMMGGQKAALSARSRGDSGVVWHSPRPHVP